MLVEVSHATQTQTSICAKTLRLKLRILADAMQKLNTASHGCQDGCRLSGVFLDQNLSSTLESVQRSHRRE